jgi:Bacterial Ig-like domain (group 3)
MAHRDRRHRCPIRSQQSRLHMEALEERSLFSITYATMVLEAPHSASVPPVQVDPIFQAPNVAGATLNSELEIQVRVVSAGIYLSASVSSPSTGDPDPTGTIDFYSDAGYIGSATLGTLGDANSYRDMTHIIASGQHTFFAVYSGDSNYHFSQNSVQVVLFSPTTTLPKGTSSSAFVTNTSKLKERVRPMRRLSNLQFGTTGTYPTQRFANVTFSLPRK